MGKGRHAGDAILFFEYAAQCSGEPGASSVGVMVELNRGVATWYGSSLLA